MPSSLARQILDLHRVPPSGPRPAAGDEVELAVDHVAVGGAGAALVFLAFEATGVPRARPELVLACGERDGGVDLVDPADAIALGEAAARAGAVLSRAGVSPTTTRSALARPSPRTRSAFSTRWRTLVP